MGSWLRADPRYSDGCSDSDLLPEVSNRAANKTQKTKVSGCVKAHWSILYVKVSGCVEAHCTILYVKVSGCVKTHCSILYVKKRLSFYDHLHLQQGLLVDLIC